MIENMRNMIGNSPSMTVICLALMKLLVKSQPINPQQQWRIQDFMFGEGA